MLSRLAMRRIASPNSPATETTSTFGESVDRLGLHAVGHVEPLDRAGVEAVAWPGR